MELLRIIEKKGRSYCNIPGRSKLTSIGTRKIMSELFFINVVIVLGDIALLVLEYSGERTMERVFKGCIYSTHLILLSTSHSDYAIFRHQVEARIRHPQQTSQPCPVIPSYLVKRLGRCRYFCRRYQNKYCDFNSLGSSCKQRWHARLAHEARR